MKRGFIFFLLGLLAGPVIGIVIVNFGWWPWRATSEPPKWEHSLAVHGLHTAVKREAANIKTPIEPNDEVLLAGMKIFRMNCAGCHGDFGQPSVWGTNAFYPRVPQFATSPPTLRAEEMFLIVRNGVRYSGMGAWKDLMSEEETWKAVLFLSQIGTLPPAVRQEWEAAKKQ